MNSVCRSAAAAVLMAFASTSGAQTITLDQAIDAVLHRNPVIAATEARERTAQAREGAARAARFPRVDVTESVTRGNNPVFVFGSLLEQGRFAARHFDPAFLNAPDDLTNHRAGLTARVALFDGLRISNAIRQTRNGTERASAEIEEVRQRLRAEVVTAWYGVIVAEERLNVAREAATTAEADAKAARDRFEQGLVVESDALSAGVQLAAFRQRVIAAEGELAIARSGLAVLLQRPPDDAIAVAGTLPEPPPEISVEEALARARMQRAPVTIAAIDTANAQLQLSAERGTMLPRVDAFGTFGASGQTFGSRSTDHTAGVIVTAELFDRSRPSRIAAARSEIDAARAAESIARDAVTMEVVTAWHRLRAARARTSVAATAAIQAEAAARIVRDRYTAGLVTITEQLRAQTALAGARLDAIAARYESLVAYAELLRATGDLNHVQPFL